MAPELYPTAVDAPSKSCRRRLATPIWGIDPLPAVLENPFFQVKFHFSSVFKLFKRPSLKSEQLVESQPNYWRERRKIPRELSTAYEVTEGNAEADWLLWEESVSFQDSKMHCASMSLPPSRTSQAAAKVQAEVTGAFDSVLKRAP